MKFYIFLILLGFVLGIGIAITGWPIWIAYIVIVVVGVPHLLSPIYILYRSKNLEALTKIVDKFKKIRSIFICTCYEMERMKN